MEYGVQAMALAILLSILFSYFQNERMPLLSTKVFTGFLLLALFNNLAEFSTLYALKHYGEVSDVLLRVTHQLFIGSLDLMVLFLFLYVDIKSRRKKRYSVGEWCARMLPAAVSIVMVVFGRLEYHISERGSYSYGPMAMTVYVSVVIYLLLIVLCIARRGESFSGKAKRNLYYGIACWSGVALFQYFFPTFLLSSMASVLMVQFVYISFENPREMQDGEIEDVFSGYAMKQVLAEHERRKDTVYILTMVLSDAGILQKAVRLRELPAAMKSAADYLRSLCRGRLYRPENNVLCMILKSEDVMLKALQNNSNCARNQQGPVYQAAGGSTTQLSFFMTVLECPKYVSTTEEVMETIEFVGHKGKKQQLEGVVIADQEFIENKNYRVRVEQVVRDAVANDGFEVYFQPIFASGTGCFASAEALVRLKDTTTLGYISPDVFIPVAEERGLIEELGNIVFEKVCQAISGNRLWELGVKYIEVNVSGIQIANEKLSDVLMGYMKKYEIAPEFINLEITETAAVEVENNLFHNMLKLRKVGFHFSMDDFGTGYSNFSQMAERRFELIKLDKSLIWPCFGENAEKAVVILEGCITMIKKLGLSIVAEGVETKEQADYLIEKGVEYLQGYYFSRPLAEKDYIAFLNKNNKEDRL